MSLIKYRAFIAAVETGSLTKTAQLLGYSQPGISKMIESLEIELNATLFIRNGSTIDITETGKIVYRYAVKMVDQESAMLDAIHSMNGLIIGSIRIGALNSIIIDCVPRIIKEYSEAYPIIEISLNQLSYAEVLENLRMNSIDIGFTSKFDVAGLTFIPLFKDPARLIVPRNHPLASLERVSVDALNGSDMIMLPPGGDDVILAVKNKEKFSVKTKYYVHSDAAATSMVAAGLGIYIISDMQCANLPESVVAKEFDTDIYRTMGIGVKAQKLNAPAVKEMIRIAKTQTKDLDAAPNHL